MGLEEIAAGLVIGGRFELLERVGRGAMGEVWRASDRAASTDAAIKLLHKELSDAELVRSRFEREGRVLSELVHPHIARLRAWNANPERSFLALDFIAGPTMFAMVRDAAIIGAPPSPDRAVAIARGIASGLDAAHASGVVHRDLKPGNVIMRQGSSRPDDPVIVDFGAAKVSAPPSEGTTVGRVLGSWLYMSPEQIRGEAVDHRTDIFSLAVMIFELLCLRRPFVCDDRGEPINFASRDVLERIRAGQLLRWMVLEQPPRVSKFRPGMPAELDAVLIRGFAPERDARFQTAGQLVEAIAQCLSGGFAPMTDARVTVLNRPPALDRSATITREIGDGDSARRDTDPPSSAASAVTELPSLTPILIPSPMLPPPAPARAINWGTLAFGGLMLATGLLIGVLLTRNTPAPPAPIAEAPPRAVASPSITPMPSTSPPVAEEPAPKIEKPKPKLIEETPEPQRSPLQIAIENAERDPTAPGAKQALRAALESVKEGASTELRSELDRCLTAAQFRPSTESLIACAKIALGIDQRRTPR